MGAEKLSVQYRIIKKNDPVPEADELFLIDREELGFQLPNAQTILKPESDDTLTVRVSPYDKKQQVDSSVDTFTIFRKIPGYTCYDHERGMMLHFRSQGGALIVEGLQTKLKPDTKK